MSLPRARHKHLGIWVLLLCASHETFFYLLHTPKWITWCFCVKKPKTTKLTILYIHICVCCGLCDFLLEGVYISMGIGICVCVFNVSVFLIKKLKCELLHKIAKTKTVKSRLIQLGRRPKLWKCNSNFYITK